MVVVVIDFGIIFSGYVFLWKYEWVKVYINDWYVGNFMSSKVLIILFLKEDKLFFVFGYEVENIYRENVEKFSFDFDSESDE